MGLGRKKCVLKKKMMQYDEFMERIKKSFYYGDDGLEDNLELTSPLAEYASEIFSEPQKGNSLQRLTKFSAGNVRVPNPCSLIMALIYLDRLNESNPGYVRNGIAPSDLFLVSVIISSKFCYDVDEDSTFYLDDFLQDCDMSLERYKKLEIEFLCAIDWNVYISNESFEQKLLNIEKFLAKREGIRRGWLTYTELLHFLPTFTFAKFLLNNITVMAVSYVASVMTMAGAFFLVSNIPGNGLLQINRQQICNNGIIKSTSEQINSTTTTLNDENDNNIGNGNDSATTTTPIGLNVEKELQKLEEQYKIEEEMLKLKKHNNDNDYNNPLNNLFKNYLVQDTFHHGFNAVKGIGTTTFPVYNNRNRPGKENLLNKIYPFNVDDDNYYEIVDKLNYIQNYTKTIFWDFVHDTEKSLKIPFVWFKFI